MVEKWNAGGRILDAFADEAEGDRRSALTEREKQRHILNFVSHQNANGKQLTTLT